MTQEIINNRYKIIKILGEGGFGKTFLTEDIHMPSHRYSVIKVLKPINNNPQIYKLIQDRFHREAVILEELGNSNNRIPKLYAYFSEQDQFYLVQEYIEGQTLAHKLQHLGPMSESAVKEILKSMLYVLNFVHSRQIVHRDIKPDNIIFRESDSVPVLIDFGAVRESMGTITNSQGQPTSSIVIGTPGFMPPEQAAGRPVYNSDLYSLALTMIYLLTGKMPQELQDPRTANFVWHQYAPNVSPNLRIVLDKAIAYNPNERYLSAKDMLDALQSPQFPHIEATQPNFPGVSPAEPDTIIKQNPPPDINQGFQPNSGGRGNTNQNNQQPGFNQGYQSNSGGGYTNQNDQQPAFNQGYQSNWVGGGGTFNTSTQVPQEVQGWNWGAFLLSPIWSITNQVWIGLISCIPFIGIPMNFILGAKGNAWAWKSRPWGSIQAFKAHQRTLTIVGLSITPFWAPLVIVFYAGALSGGDTMTQTSNQSQTNLPTPSFSPSTSTPEPVTTPSTSTSTSTTKNQFLPVEINSLKNYTYKTGLFSISIPEGWKIEDKSQPGEAIVLWQDKYENGGIFIHVFAAQGNETKDQLTEILKRSVNKAFSNLPSFSMDQPVVLGSGRVRISWSYKFTQGNKQGLFLGNSFVQQQGNKISFYTDVVPQEQFDRLKPSLEQILATYQVDPSAALP